jgi:hypothetical protein
MKNSLKSVFLVAHLTYLFAGCATLTKSPQAEIRLSSYPQNVQVLLNGYSQGNTPLTVSVNRKENHNVTFIMRGHQPVHVQITPKLDFTTTILGNLVSWNIIGVVVDLVTGSAYTLSPADIEQYFDFLSKNVNVRSSGKEIQIFILTQDEWSQLKAKEDFITRN